jgi:hypothetical protein
MAMSAVVILAIIIISSIFLTDNIISRLINPEFMALKELFNLLKGK